MTKSYVESGLSKEQLVLGFENLGDHNPTIYFYYSQNLVARNLNFSTLSSPSYIISYTKERSKMSTQRLYDKYVKDVVICPFCKGKLDLEENEQKNMRGDWFWYECHGNGCGFSAPTRKDKKEAREVIESIRGVLND